MATASTSKVNASKRKLPWGLRRVVFAIQGLCVFVFFLSPLFGKLVFVGLPCLAFAVILWPLFRESRTSVDLCTPWTFVVLNVMFGVTLRGIYIEFDWPSASRIDEFLLGGNSKAGFLYPNALLVVCLALLAAGYHFGKKHNEGHQSGFLPGRLSHDRWSDRRLTIVACLLSAIALAAFVILVRETGGLDLSRLSAKRNYIKGLFPGDFTYRGRGTLRTLGSLGNIALLLVMARVTFSKAPLTTAKVGLLLLLFGIAIAVPFYVSSRATIIWTLTSMFAVVYYSGRRIRWRTLVAVVLISAALVSAMGKLRVGEEVELADNPALADPLEPFVITRNFIGIAKFGRIVNAPLAQLPRAHGRTLVAWIVAPIPRELWPGKPVIQSGPELAQRLYGFPTNIPAGIPPGFMGELHWNFGPVGLVLACPFLGVFLRRLYGRSGLADPNTRDRNRVVFYVVAIFPVSVWFLDGGVGGGFFRLLREAILAIGCLVLVNSPVRSVNRDSGPRRRPSLARPSP